MMDKRFKPPFHERLIQEPNSGCWLWEGPYNKGGYGVTAVNKKPVLAHRLSYAKHRGQIPSGLKVLHKCDVRCCVNPDHLFLGTQRDNILDMERKCRGRHPRKESHGRAKLTEQQIEYIRSRIGEPVGWQRETARMFGVSDSTISSIAKNITWKGK